MSLAYDLIYICTCVKQTAEKIPSGLFVAKKINVEMNILNMYVYTMFATNKFSEFKFIFI